jgi:hypothetical protein
MCSSTAVGIAVGIAVDMGGGRYQRVARILRAEGHEQPLGLENDGALSAIRNSTSSTTRPWQPGTLTRRRARADGRLGDMDTGDDLIITKPKRTADGLLQVAAA